jgi:hypothetical protein
VNASRARRRWLKWCRYVDKTQSIRAGSKMAFTEIHEGQAKAYQDAMFARRYFPKGARQPFYPRWASAR